MDDDYWKPFYPSMSLPEVSDFEPQWTGLLDADGERIYRRPRRIGFHHFDPVTGLVVDD